MKRMRVPRRAMGRMCCRRSREMRAMSFLVAEWLSLRALKVVANRDDIGGILLALSGRRVDFGS